MTTTFSERLKELRKKEKITQKDLATAIDVSIRTIVSYENGSRQPTGIILDALASHFGVSTSYLLGRTDNPLGLIRPWETTSGTSDFTLALVRLDALYDMASAEDKAKINNICSTIYKIGKNNFSHLSEVETFVTRWKYLAPLLTTQTTPDEYLENSLHKAIYAFNDFLQYAEQSIKYEQISKTIRNPDGSYDISKIAALDLVDLQTLGLNNKEGDL